MSTINSTRITIQPVIDNTKQDISDLQESVSLIETDIAGIESDVSAAELDISNAQSDISGLQSTVSSNSSSISSLQSTKANLSGASFTGTVTVPSPPSNGSSGVRNITMSTGGPSGGADGDIWIRYT